MTPDLAVKLIGFVAFAAIAFADLQTTKGEVATLRQSVANLQARVAEMGGQISCPRN